MINEEWCFDLAVFRKNMELLKKLTLKYNGEYLGTFWYNTYCELRYSIVLESGYERQLDMQLHKIGVDYTLSQNGEACLLIVYYNYPVYLSEIDYNSIKCKFIEIYSECRMQNLGDLTGIFFGTVGITLKLRSDRKFVLKDAAELQPNLVVLIEDLIQLCRKTGRIINSVRTEGLFDTDDLSKRRGWCVFDSSNQPNNRYMVFV